MNLKMMPGINTALWRSFANEQISQTTLQAPRQGSLMPVPLYTFLPQIQRTLLKCRPSTESVKMDKMMPRGTSKMLVHLGYNMLFWAIWVTRQNKA